MSVRIGKLICWLTKHKRGRLMESWVQPSEPPVRYSTFQCTRCFATWTRKKAAK